MASWLSNWKNRRKITISNTNIDAILSNFPILIYISASSGTGSADITDIFTELGADANRKKIAITTSDGTTECPTEIERFDFANSLAWLWVKVPSVAAASVTELYCYYDVSQADNTTYIGDTGDTPAQNVWDSNFKLVMHMAQDPNGDVADAIKDSTSNANHGTPAGTMTTADLVDGKIGKAIDFDGIDDCLDVGDTPDVDFGSGNWSIEACIYPQSVANLAYIIVGKDDDTLGEQIFLQYRDTRKIRTRYYTAGDTAVTFDSTGTVTLSAWNYIVGQRSGDGFEVYMDGGLDSSGTTAGTHGTMQNTAARLYIGKRTYSTSEDFFKDIIEEIRISNIARSAAWLKATYYSNWDGLVTYGEPSIGVFFPNPMGVIASIQSNIQIELSSNLLTANASMYIGGLFSGALVACPSPFSAQVFLQSSPTIEVVSAQFTAIGALQALPAFQVSTGGALIATGSISARVEEPFSIAVLPRAYTFTITGAADGVDDIIIPIGSFQSRIKSGDPTYLSVVIPGTDWASEINARLNGELIVKMGYRLNNEIVLSEIISQVTMDGIRIDKGSSKQSITLDGYKTEVFAHKEVDLKNPIYSNLDAGKLRYRCTPDLYLKPGDTAHINDDSFIVDTVSFSVSAELETYEIAEA